jgi:alkanesulfonate monooxygenase SsuD/methylene tetrahydromethanopterin reductase-like flavin-dependent oxidoreductase (luciferase family)
MTDYGHPISFGVSLDPSADRLDETRRMVATAAAGGLDYLAVQDHPYQPGYLDTWTLISHLAAGTERISFLTDVADLQLRPPAMLAKAAASLSVLTSGRVTLGVGGGASADAIVAMGGGRRSGPEMVAYTEESLLVLRQALAGGTVRQSTGQHTIEGYAAGPIPPAAVPVWVGAHRPRMLALTGRLGDGWIAPLNLYVPPAAVPSRQRAIDEAARSAGRNPSAVRRISNVIGTIGTSAGGLGLAGDVPYWIGTLAEWAVGLGFDTFVFWPATAPPAQLELFLSEVVPGVRERVAGIRGTR